MARWGQGDPRWLVQHREDGTNINGWHWEERNMLPWTRQRLQNLFEEAPVATECSEGTVKLIRVKDVSGEAALTKRKGNKKFAFYDLKVTLEWEAQDAETGSHVKGTCTLSEFTTGHDEDDVEFEVKAEGKGDANDRMTKTVSRTRAAVYDKLRSLAQELEKQ